MTEPPTTYRITFRALSDTTPPTNRLKRLLKVAGVEQDSAPNGASEEETTFQSNPTRQNDGGQLDSCDGPSRSV